MKDIDAIRRENLRLIELEAGGPAEAARRLNMSPSQFSNLREGAKDSKTGKPRGMRKETARRIESSASKPPGWLDTDHTQAGPTGPTSPVDLLHPPAPWPFEVVQERLRVLHKGDWAALNLTMKTMVELRERDRLEVKSARG